VRRDLGRDALSERAEDVRSRLEAVLVQVVARALSRAEDEVALEVCVLDERASDAPSSYVIIEPSS